MKVSAARRRSGSVVLDASSSRASTVLRRCTASATVLKPTACSARPGTGSVRDTEPGASTSTSYGTATVPSTVATRRPVSTPVTRPVITSQPRSTLRSGTRCRGSIQPAATSARNGWYVIVGDGSTTVTVASPRRSLRRSRRAVYMPT